MKWICIIYGIIAFCASEVVSTVKEDDDLINRIQTQVNETLIRSKRQSDRTWDDLVVCRLEDGTCYQNKECQSQYWGAAKELWTECKCSAGFTKRPYHCKQAELCEIKIQRWGCHWMLMCEIEVDMSIREAWRYERHGQCTLSIFTVIGVIVGDILVVGLVIGGFFFYQRRKRMSFESESRVSSPQVLPLKEEHLLSLQRSSSRASSRCISPAPSSIISAINFNGVQKDPAPKRSFTPLHKQGKGPKRPSFSRPLSPNSSVLSGYSSVPSPQNNTTNSIISNTSAISELERPMRRGSKSEKF
ncbi:unnamed protein product [Meganyctiphanes norvegica]|uniref:Uncharacterized protein n=1 Tax=Meganyctiphanes norvegica TaxID=48144 RepID=A0AAV2QQD0_MEGNR